MKAKTMKDKPWHSIVMALLACIVAIGAFASEAKAQAKKPTTLVEHLATSATGATTADAADTNKEQLAYSIGVQAYLYGQPIMDLYPTFWENTEAAKQKAREKFLPSLMAHLDQAGLGHVSEIADADSSHTPRGCPFQACSIGELLRLSHVVLASDGKIPAKPLSPVDVR